MSVNAKRNADAGAEMLTPFNVQVCSRDGRVLSEFTLTLFDDDVGTLSAAERYARKRLSDYHGEPPIIVVSSVAPFL